MKVQEATDLDGEDALAARGTRLAPRRADTDTRMTASDTLLLNRTDLSKANVPRCSSDLL